MLFDEYLAIDWSGAKKTPTESIQVATYDPKTKKVTVVPSSTRSATGWNRWTRKEVLQYVQRQIAKRRVLIGFDFAFGYPYCDKSTYFPGYADSPGNVRNLWKTVDGFCKANNGGDFYGGSFYSGSGSRFKRYYRQNGGEPQPKELRSRVTDDWAKEPAGRIPSSAFNCVGPNQVGPGSLAGMRLLHKLQHDTNIAIWPFDATDEQGRSTIVEIYPRLFIKKAKGMKGECPPPSTVRELVGCYGAILEDKCEKWSEHERDALVSAAGMGWFASRQEIWTAPAKACSCAAAY